MRPYQEIYFPLLYFCVMLAHAHFIVTGTWYSFHLNVPDISNMFSSVTWSTKEQCHITSNTYTSDVQNCYSLNTQQLCSTYHRLCAQIMECQELHEKV